MRDTVLSQPDHTAWSVLDRARVESLVSNDAAALDTMSRYYVWRLATVFLGSAREPAHGDATRDPVEGHELGLSGPPSELLSLDPEGRL